VHDILPGENVLPTSTNEIKKFLKMFGFGYDIIHACPNDCILYRKAYELRDTCPGCSASRWKRDKHTGEEKKGIPAKVLWYFPSKIDSSECLDPRKWLRTYGGILAMLVMMVQCDIQ